MDQISYIYQKLEKNGGFSETAHQPFLNFKEAYSTVRKEILQKSLRKFGVSPDPVSLIAMCLTRIVVSA
jgi:hypothetical protein